MRLEGLDSVIISGKEVLPIIEGGKGIGATNGVSAGAFAKAGAVGTFSGVNPDSYDADGNPSPVVYRGTTRKERHDELIAMGIQGGITQAKIAHDMSGGNGRIHINVLWEMGGVEPILHGVLQGAKGLIHGITCGAGLPYKIIEFASEYNVYYYPIVSSMRAFKVLWKRSYHKLPEKLGGVVYEDPWLAGGHNGLSNSEDPRRPEDPFPRVAELRKFMNEVGLQHVPVIMAGGVWRLDEWQHWLRNPEIGPVAFQFGSRPLLTQESPISERWKKRLLTLESGEVSLHQFSPTGFYSSAVRNTFLRELEGRSERQIEFRPAAEGVFTDSIPFGPRARPIYVTPEDKQKAQQWIQQGFNELLKTPSSTVIFVNKDKADEIISDQINCMGCLSHCQFSNWKDHDEYTTGKKTDPRSFCIQKTLQNIVHGADVEHELMFAGHNAYRFSQDSFYEQGFVPTVKQLVDRIMAGE
ncbi:MAG: nitronate monooxygenase [Alphaproteobacteria bacterium]|nr:nitronate monooxygenase [Alphaproteobacteria bacterium]